MRYIISVDDTDDLTKETSTGLIANQIAKKLKNDYDAKINKGVTRHQLLLAEGIPYTSHNSAMAIDVSCEKSINEIAEIAKKIVIENMAKTACPGLCILLADDFENEKELVSYGLKTKKEIVKKEETLSLIEKYKDVLLGFELGGNGQGIIGALAGIGLRLFGNDGTFRGKAKIPQGTNFVTVKDFKTEYKAEDVLDAETRKSLDDETKIFCEDFAKLFFINHKKVALAIKNSENDYTVCNREKAFQIEDSLLNAKSFCPKFVLDNDINECQTEERACPNCLYRRLTADGFVCRLEKQQNT